MKLKLFKSFGLVFGTIAALVTGVPGLVPCVVIWIILSGLFVFSRFSKRLGVFGEWSWVEFLLTIGGALGVPYIALLFSPGF